MWLVSAELNFEKTFDEVYRSYSYRQMRGILELSAWYKKVINKGNDKNDEIQKALRDHHMMSDQGFV